MTPSGGGGTRPPPVTPSPFLADIKKGDIKKGDIKKADSSAGSGGDKWQNRKSGGGKASVGAGGMEKVEDSS
jgi:hypothetical protein